MSDNQRCFIIEHQELYLDCVLIEFNGTPLFFVCKNEKGIYYIVLCYDIDTLSYYVAECRDSMVVADMIKGKVAMVDVFINALSIWDISTGESIEDDIVYKIKFEALRTDCLPNNNAYYEIIDSSVKDYVKSIIDNQNTYLSTWIDVTSDLIDIAQVWDEIIVSDYTLSKRIYIDDEIIYKETSELKLGENVEETVVEAKEQKYTEIKELKAA